MQRNGATYLRMRVLWTGAALAAAFWARDLIWQAAVQLFFGMLVALAALPVMKRLEKRFSPATAALVFRSPARGTPMLTTTTASRTSASASASPLPRLWERSAA